MIRWFCHVFNRCNFIIVIIMVILFFFLLLRLRLTLHSSIRFYRLCAPRKIPIQTRAHNTNITFSLLDIRNNIVFWCSMNNAVSYFHFYFIHRVNGGSIVSFRFIWFAGRKVNPVAVFVGYFESVSWISKTFEMYLYKDRHTHTHSHMHNCSIHNRSPYK